MLNAVRAAPDLDPPWRSPPSFLIGARFARPPAGPHPQTMYCVPCTHITNTCPLTSRVYPFCAFAGPVESLGPRKSNVCPNAGALSRPRAVRPVLWGLPFVRGGQAESELAARARVAVVGTVPAAVRHRSPGRSLGRACTVYHVPTRPMLSARPPDAAAWRGLSSRPAPGLLWWVRFRRRSGTVLRIGSRRPFPGPLQNCAALLRRRVDALRARRTAGPCAICEPDSRPAFTRGVLRTPGSVSSHRLSIDGVGLPRARA